MGFCCVYKASHACIWYCNLNFNHVLISISAVTELDQLFADAPCYELSFASASGRSLVEVLHAATIFSSLGKQRDSSLTAGATVTWTYVWLVLGLFGLVYVLLYRRG